jgi:4-hydroxy-tetrahydrodipicolinate synthase
MSHIFKGLSAFAITPCNADGVLDTPLLQDLMVRLRAAGVASIGLLGSTGTYVYLDRDTRRRATESAAAVKGDTPMIVGVGALRTDQAVALAADAAASGADGLLLAPVSYTPLTEDEACAHYIAVAEATDLPLCIYNNPGTTHFTFSHSLLQRLATHPQIAAVKMPPPVQITPDADLAALRGILPADFMIGYSGDWFCGETLLAGADAFYTALGGTLPQTFVALARMAMAGDREGTAALDARLAPLMQLCRQHGSLRLAYALTERLGLGSAVLPRPLLPLNTDAMAALDSWLGENSDLAC